jgi:hypothetical protein
MAIAAGYRADQPLEKADHRVFCGCRDIVHTVIGSTDFLFIHGGI